MTTHDPFSLLSEKNEALRAGARRTLGEHTGSILLGVCLVLTAVLPLVVLELVNPFSEAFLLRTAYTVLTSTLAYLLFIPEGKRTEWLQNGALDEASARLGRLSAAVREGHLSEFSLFCKSRAEGELAHRRAALVAGGEGDPRRARRMARKAARLRPRTISPALVLCGEETSELSRVGRREPLYGARRVLLRPIPVLLSSLLFSSVVILPGSALDAATAVRILSGLFGVVMAAFAGFTAGREGARCELGRLEGRILFLSSFFEERKSAV